MSMPETVETPLAATGCGGGGSGGFQVPDDVLVHILSFLPTTADAMRASVVARQWKLAWTRLPALRFKSGCHAQSREQAAQFTRFVDGALARYAYSTMHSLEISVSHGAALVPAEQATAWLHYAGERVEELFLLRTASEAQRPEQPPGREAVEFPSRARTKAITLWLGQATLRLPAAAPPGAFDALTELLLGKVRFGDGSGCGGDGRALGDFASSCCPRLRKLHVDDPAGLATLLLRTESLEELQITNCYHDFELEVAAPRLRVLDLDFLRASCTGELGVARIAAPRLEELSWNEWRSHEVALLPLAVAFDQTSSVRCLSNVRLITHPNPSASNISGIWLLQHCTRADRILLRLGIPDQDFLHECEDPFEKVPELPNIRILTLHIESWGNVIVTSMTTLLRRCTNVQTLHIHIEKSIYLEEDEDRVPMDRHLHQKWGNRKTSLASLTEVEIHSFKGVKCEISLVKFLFKNAAVLERMTIISSKKMVPSKGAFTKLAGTIDHRRGCWTYDADGYRWTRGAKMGR